MAYVAGVSAGLYFYFPKPSNVPAQKQTGLLVLPGLGLLRLCVYACQAASTYTQSVPGQAGLSCLVRDGLFFFFFLFHFLSCYRIRSWSGRLLLSGPGRIIFFFFLFLIFFFLFIFHFLSCYTIRSWLGRLVLSGQGRIFFFLSFPKLLHNPFLVRQACSVWPGTDYFFFFFFFSSFLHSNASVKLFVVDYPLQNTQGGILGPKSWHESLCVTI